MSGKEMIRKSRSPVSVTCCVVLSLVWSAALAQGKSAGTVAEPEQDQIMIEEPETPPPSDILLDPNAPTAVELNAANVTTTAEDQEGMASDVVALPRKEFLKRQRFEVAPYFGLTLNDSLIHHNAVGGEVNYFLTEAMAVGATGMYYFGSVLDQEFLTRYHFRRAPSLNKYSFTATGNFSYVPIIGKFSVMNKWIMHYEAYVLGGVGVTGTEVIPRDAANESFSNMALTFPIGIGGRLFLNRWLTATFSIRDYMMIDKFEPTTRGVDGEEAKSRAETRFINNVMFNVGVSFFFPTSFDYRSED